MSPIAKTLLALCFSMLVVGECIAAPKPDFVAGKWVLTAAVDEDGTSWDGSTLKFTSQEKTTTGFRLSGYFVWRNRKEVRGRENVTGNYSEKTRILALEGHSIEKPVATVAAAYRAVLSSDRRFLSHGSWSTKNDGELAVSGKWTATLVGDYKARPRSTLHGIKRAKN